MSCCIAIIINMLITNTQLVQNLQQNDALLIASGCCIVLPFIIMHARICEQVKYLIVVSGLLMLVISFGLSSTGLYTEYYESPCFSLIFIPYSGSFLIWLVSGCCGNLSNITRGITKKEQVTLESKIETYVRLKEQNCSEHWSNLKEFISKSKGKSEIPGVYY